MNLQQSTKLMAPFVSVVLCLAALRADEPQKQRAPGDPDLPWIAVREVAAAPQIDGKLNDACWKSAKASPRFIGEYGFP